MTDETRQNPSQTVSHATPAQIKFLQKHLRTDLAKAGYLTKFAGRGNNRFIGRMRDAGMIEIVDPNGRWPWSWTGTRITPVGRATLEQLIAPLQTASPPSTTSRRISPDMNLRWWPVIDGKVIVGGAVPFSGFATKAEAVSASKQLTSSQRPKGKR
jgi:hypothetical protein